MWVVWKTNGMEIGILNIERKEKKNQIKSLLEHFNLSDVLGQIQNSSKFTLYCLTFSKI
jgi:hypothetical protein